MMQDVVHSIVTFVAILNPFALCLYLTGIMEDLERRQFAVVLAQASSISFAVFAVFATGGDLLLVNVLGVNPSALRVFGGALFFVVGYNYATKGYKAAEQLRGELHELPSTIALPYMIGAGTITQSILVGKRHPWHTSVLLLLVGVVLSYLVVIAFRELGDRMSRTRGQVFARYVNILARVNGLLIGAISTDMIFQGIHDLWLSPAPK